MKSLILLSWRYLTYHRTRSAILTGCIVLVALLPFSLEIFLSQFQHYLTERAAETPLVIGGKGSRYDLLLSSLYFRGRPGERTTMALAEEVDDTGLALALPLHLEHRVERDGDRYPIVGTIPEYYEFRGLRVTAGTLPLVLGDAVLGASVASSLGIDVGGTVTSAPDTVYDLAATYPLRMRVVGVLERTATSDDWAVFVDVKTAWVISGIGHGHQDLKDSELLKEEGETQVANASVFMANVITADNIDSFHFHGDVSDFPVTAVIAVPSDHKSATLLMGRYQVSDHAQYLKPSEVLDELLGLVLRVKQLFDANTILVLVATILFLVLIVNLTLRVRAREMETLYKLGCDRLTVFKLQVIELSIVIATALVVASLLAYTLGWLAASGSLSR